MDRRRQLSNVSFGGAWSEQIEGDERISQAMRCLDGAVSLTRYEDLRGFEDVASALEALCERHPKGELLAAAWRKALAQPNAELRALELRRIEQTLRAGFLPSAGSQED